MPPRFFIIHQKHSSFWSDTESVKLNHYMGERPVHFPLVTVQARYDSEGLDLRFEVQDRYVLATAKHHQDPVCRDSCVEFFFTPGTDLSKGYFNLEINCGGTVLFHYQPRPREDAVPLPLSLCEQIVTAHSLPKIMHPEGTEPVTWSVECTIPFEALSSYTEVTRPGPGVLWRANFYKCADASSHPHWLTWAEVDHPVPDFHRPSAFGELVFA